jgi:hypothetical protein
VPKTLGAEAHKRENVDFAGQWDKIVIVPYHVCAPMCLALQEPNASCTATESSI